MVCVCIQVALSKHTSIYFGWMIISIYFYTGHSPEQVAGHHLYLMGAKPATGWNGRYGYRRNTPDLRTRSSCFGEVTWLPIH